MDERFFGPVSLFRTFGSSIEGGGYDGRTVLWVGLPLSDIRNGFVRRQSVLVVLSVSFNFLRPGIVGKLTGC